MTEKVVVEVVRAEHMTLSQLIWRMFRRQPRGYLERVLAANQNLSLQAPFLTVGASVRLPVEDVAEIDQARIDVVRLWD